MLLSISLKVALTEREGASESLPQKRSPGTLGGCTSVSFVRAS